MNNAVLMVQKLSELLKLAEQAESGFEKAAVFAAASCIADQFAKAFDDGKIDSYASEKVHNAIWSIKAIVGYDVDNGHKKSQHVSWAYGELMTLQSILE